MKRCLFFILVIYSRIDCEVLSRLSLLSVWEWFFIDILNPSRHVWDFSLFMVDHVRYLPGHGSQVVFSPCAVAMNNLDIGQPHLWAVNYEISPLMADIIVPCTSSRSRSRPMWTTMRSGNHIYELLYEFGLHCHLLGNLIIRSPPFWQQWFQVSLNWINSSGTLKK